MGPIYAELVRVSRCSTKTAKRLRIASRGLTATTGRHLEFNRTGNETRSGSVIRCGNMVT